MKSSRRQIGIIGCLADGAEMFDGQTVKTRLLAEALSEIENVSVVKVDTYRYRYHALKTIFALLKCFCSCDLIFVLLAAGGRKYLFPVISIMNRVFKRKIIHDLIGGALAEDVKENPKIARHLNSFSENWVESRLMVEELFELGVRNARYVPNCKRLDPAQIVVDGRFSRLPLRACTFSRVTPKKGLESAIRAVSLINSNYEACKIELDIYGLIDEGYRDCFELAVAASNEVSYKGVAEPGDSVRILQSYDVLLFPTEFYTEGIPGTIVDAFFAGLPVVSSRWKYHDELLSDGKTGYSYPFGKQDELIPAIQKIIDNPIVLNDFSHECMERARGYSYESFVRFLRTVIEGDSVDFEKCVRNSHGQ